MKRWVKIADKEVFRTPYFSITSNTFSDSVSYEDDFYRFNFGDWVHVIPETAESDILMIKQFRFGTEKYSLEFPGGQVEPGSSPLDAANAELVEETGYSSQEMLEIGWAYPNPAIQKNKCFFFHARNVKLVGETALEDAEDITLVRVKRSEIPELISNGSITHSLALLAYYTVQNFITK